MKLTIIGTGYVGLVSGVCFAELGHKVTCVDKDAAKIEMLRAGQSPIYEPGLEEMLARNIALGRIDFTLDFKTALNDSEVCFIAVGTPPDPETGQADLQYVMAAAKEIAQAANGPLIIVTKSTVPIGTNREVERCARAASPEAVIDIASNPEFLREGAAIRDFLEPDRIVVGVETDRARSALEKVYRPLVNRGLPLVFTTIEAAEIIKYSANAFLAMKVAFINQIADLCEKTGADIEEVSHGIGLDQRIGARFLKAGPGYGGSCFPKDTQALAHTAREFGSPVTIIDTVIAENKKRKQSMASRVLDVIDGSIRGKKIAILGVAFKGGTDDMRDSPALDIIPALQEMGALVSAYDPAAMDKAKEMLSGVDWNHSAYDVVTDAEIVMVVTEWDDFAALDLKVLKRKMKAPVMVDLRNLFDPEEVTAAGFTYSSIGRAIQYPA